MLDDPLRGRVSRYVEVPDFPASVLDDEEAIQQFESDRRNGKEVQRGDDLAVIGQEGQPPLARISAPTDTAQIPGYGPLRNGEARASEVRRVFSALPKSGFLLPRAGLTYGFQPWLPVGRRLLVTAISKRAEIRRGASRPPSLVSPRSGRRSIETKRGATSSRTTGPTDSNAGADASA